MYNQSKCTANARCSKRFKRAFGTKFKRNERNEESIFTITLFILINSSVACFAVT